ADVGTVAGSAHERLVKWVEDGGVLVRFAGPRLAAGDDELVPVKLRRGGRLLGGSLSWEQPQQLASVSRDGPVARMEVPGDVSVTGGVGGDPGGARAARPGAARGDATRRVTASRRGKGVLVLSHVTADTRWSNLPLSGAFVEMLKRVVGLSGSTATETDASQ